MTDCFVVLIPKVRQIDLFSLASANKKKKKRIAHIKEPIVRLQAVVLLKDMSAYIYIIITTQQHYIKHKEVSSANLCNNV